MKFLIIRDVPDARLKPTPPSTEPQLIEEVMHIILDNPHSIFAKVFEDKEECLKVVHYMLLLNNRGIYNKLVQATFLVEPLGYTCRQPGKCMLSCLGRVWDVVSAAAAGRWSEKNQLLEGKRCLTGGKFV